MAAGMPQLMNMMRKPEANQSLMGVVLDVSRNYKTQTSSDYVTRIKLVDSTLNPLTLMQKEQRNYMQVFLFSRHNDELPQIDKIGDILLLKRFNFQHFQPRDEKCKPSGPLEVIGKKYPKSAYYVFDWASALENDFSVI